MKYLALIAFLSLALAGCNTSINSTTTNETSDLPENSSPSAQQETESQPKLESETDAAADQEDYEDLSDLFGTEAEISL